MSNANLAIENQKTKKVRVLFKIENYLGLKFGRLTIIAESEKSVNAKGEKKNKVKCQCECGSICVILIDNMKNGHTISCG
jgi:hypothetical protein